MSSSCSNCKAKLSCSCQKRTASNGKPVCTMCLASYESNLKVNSQTAGTSPSNVTVLYKGPGKINS